MKEMNVKLRQRPWFERVYKIGIGVKGFDGLVELVVGVLLLISPSLVHVILSGAAQEAGEHGGSVYHFIADYVARIDTDLSRSGLSFLILFLIIHGLVKLTLVYCLLREIIWAYPYALAILVLFLIYQVYVLIVSPGIGMVLFTLLDVLIIWLVWGEYQDLREKNVIIKH
jgi:uncharacterized membrane protein